MQVLAQVAMLFAARKHEGTLEAETFPDWLRLLALTSAAGKPEAIPLPDSLPRYWPE